MTALTVATVNDDWQTPNRTNLPGVSKHADLILAQECKYVHADPLHDWGWHHNTSTLAKAGCVVAWDHDVLTRADHGMFVGVLPGPAKMLARWCLWDKFRVDKHKLLAIAGHRPPLRYKYLWPAFDTALAAFITHHRQRDWEVIVGMDANTHGRPQPLCRITKMSWHHRGIDGFLVTEGLRVSDMRTLPRGSSDHHPVLARVSFR